VSEIGSTDCRSRTTAGAIPRVLHPKKYRPSSIVPNDINESRLYDILCVYLYLYLQSNILYRVPICVVKVFYYNAPFGPRDLRRYNNYYSKYVDCSKTLEVSAEVLQEVAAAVAAISEQYYNNNAKNIII